MIDDDIEEQISLKMKFELLARFFYYIEQDKDISFCEINSDEQRLCYFVAHRYIQENKADDLLKSLIDENDEDYIKAIRAYPSRRYWRSQFGYGQRGETGAYT